MSLVTAGREAAEVSVGSRSSSVPFRGGMTWSGAE